MADPYSSTDDICGNGRRLQHTGLGGACTSHHTPAEVHSGDRKKSRKHWKNSKDHATQLLAADAARNKARSAEAGNALHHNARRDDTRRGENPQANPRRAHHRENRPPPLSTRLRRKATCSSQCSRGEKQKPSAARSSPTPQPQTRWQPQNKPP